ncbi:TonB-dependent receptor [Aliarcobacter trophiarum LMG 25534]|uniref:Energy transduction protein TonB n=1 Tax=Aliarcobacter trophiarum LMG 25534 TaxID=1032241 RepID=A0AAD0VME9_9BACT|nr:energy transducer TonB [Aliarcobacter trophiarum]AXK49247.1 energy transduction protein TonB [Aliarcobacter trophiarum LMG 25534]RXJ91474.1 TonB-dependent receptor [Aliarcobacter trophiarum LMG 25534]
MKRYLNSFFITSSLYIVSGIVFLYSINQIQISQKKEESVTKISLNSVAIYEAVEKVEDPIKEEIKEEVIEKIVEIPTPKVIEKPKKVEKKIVKKEKKIEKVVEKVIEKPSEDIEKTEQIVENETVTKQENSALANSNIQKNQKLESEYLAKVQAKIEKNKIYPKSAKRLNQTGKVIVSFDILKDGKVTNIRIIHKSKFEKLDDASIELLANIGFFEAIPNELNKTVWNIQIPINYQIN